MANHQFNLPSNGINNSQQFLSGLSNFGQPQGGGSSDLDFSRNLFPDPTDISGGGGGSGENSFLSQFFGSNNEDGTREGGFGLPAVKALGGLANTFLGIKGFGLAKDSFNQSKKEFNANFNTQAQLTNSRLEDRQRARVASNPGYQSVSDFMSQNRIAPVGN